MAQCKAIRKSGSRCKTKVAQGETYCVVHQSDSKFSNLAPFMGGAILGSLIFPGVGTMLGVIVGGTAGLFAGKLAEKTIKRENDD